MTKLAATLQAAAAFPSVPSASGIVAKRTHLLPYLTIAPSIAGYISLGGALAHQGVAKQLKLVITKVKLTTRLLTTRPLGDVSGDAGSGMSGRKADGSD
jgi:hypothetical protein